MFVNITGEFQQINEQIYKICEEHIACKDCPLLKGQLQIGNSIVTCENTGKDK